MSNYGRGTIVRGLFHQNRKLVRFSPPNKPSIVKSKSI